MERRSEEMEFKMNRNLSRPSDKTYGSGSVKILNSINVLWLLVIS